VTSEERLARIAQLEQSVAELKSRNKGETAMTYVMTGKPRRPYNFIDRTGHVHGPFAESHTT